MGEAGIDIWTPASVSRLKQSVINDVSELFRSELEGRKLADPSDQSKSVGVDDGDKVKEAQGTLEAESKEKEDNKESKESKESSGSKESKEGKEGVDDVVITPELEDKSQKRDRDEPEPTESSEEGKPGQVLDEKQPAPSFISESWTIQLSFDIAYLAKALECKIAPPDLLQGQLSKLEVSTFTHISILSKANIK